MADDQIYDVVLDDDERCATWLAGRALPVGWHTQAGGRPRFLTRASDLWSGVRPLCLRGRTQEA